MSSWKASSGISGSLNRKTGRVKPHVPYLFFLAYTAGESAQRNTPCFPLLLQLCLHGIQTLVDHGIGPFQRFIGIGSLIAVHGVDGIPVIYLHVQRQDVVSLVVFVALYGFAAIGAISSSNSGYYY